jgi:hypothetical protein
MMERLREALATLTPRRASCLHARFWEGKQFKEIAGCTPQEYIESRKTEKSDNSTIKTKLF